MLQFLIDAILTPKWSKMPKTEYELKAVMYPAHGTHFYTA